MIEWYPILKLLHIISSTILFGTGLGTAFFMWWGNRKTDLQIKLFVAKTTVIADKFFTTPAVIIQPLTGLLLINNVGYSYFEKWLVYSYLLFILAGLCWLPVVWIQIKLRDILAHTIKEKSKLPSEYNFLFNIWFYLGWPAFTSVIIIFWLMISKLGG